MCNMFQDHNLVANFTESRDWIYARARREYWPRRRAAQLEASLRFPFVFFFPAPTKVKSN